MGGDGATSGRRSPAWPAVAGSAIVVVLLASIAVGAWQTLADLVDVRQRYAGLDGTAREQRAGSHEGLDPRVWAALRRQLHRGDTYLLVTPRGEQRGLVDRGFVTRAYAGYFLLPAVQVTSRRDATAIVFVDAPAPPQAVCTKRGARSACVLRLHA